jgi:hypothetical protein
MLEAKVRQSRVTETDSPDIKASSGRYTRASSTFTISTIVWTTSGPDLQE